MRYVHIRIPLNSFHRVQIFSFKLNLTKQWNKKARVLKKQDLWFEVALLDSSIPFVLRTELRHILECMTNILQSNQNAVLFFAIWNRNLQIFHHQTA